MTRGAVVGMAAGVAALTLSSYLTVPLRPVPLTLQTLAVTLVGALLGWRLGTVTVLTWLALGAAGAPVFADGSSGLARLTGPTGGFLVAFPFAAALTGWMIACRPRVTFMQSLPAMLAGHAVCLVVGAGWLAATIGAAPAIERGLLPFLPGALVKSAVGAAVLAAVSRRATPSPV